MQLKDHICNANFSASIVCMDDLQGGSLSDGSFCANQPALGLQGRLVSGNGCFEPGVTTFETTKNSDVESFRPHNPQYCPESVNAEPLQQNQDVVDGDRAWLTETEIVASELTGRDKCGEVFSLPGENELMVSGFSIPISEPGDTEKHTVLQQSETAENDAINRVKELGPELKTPSQSRKRRSGSLLLESGRILRSRSQDKSKDCETKDMVEEEDGATEYLVTEAKRRKSKKKKPISKMPVNQFSSIRAHLRYLLHRIKYEQNLIDAYSGEGWKGQSLEKIKPEKELQRAKCQIFRYKLKIRDLFQRIDMSLAEGKLPESLFDVDGQIDSEDIFCAKCGSKDLTLDNDIILCDGACERGFHQFCLEPPLLKEYIPPDDEGWLCPGCDCKVDCMEMLSDFQGSNFSVLDKWEKVFPEEAAAAASGMLTDDYAGLPSDDSEDDDFDPDKPEVDHMVSGDESSSDGSDYLSAADNHVTRLDKHILGLPSDDSEDDDFKPNAPDYSDHSIKESSSSDFTSDSEEENFDAILRGNELFDHGQRGSFAVGEKVKVGRGKRQSLSDELSYLLQSSDAPISAKRHVERLDYKKLHQETYADTSDDSSDEDYGETVGVKRRKNSTRTATSLATHGGPHGINMEGDIKDENHSKKECDNTPEKISENLQVGIPNMFPESGISAAECGSGDKSISRQYKRLDEGVVQRLLESFKQNQYPSQGVKESLAKELGIRIQQISKWFENARWSFRHTSRMQSKMAGIASANGTSSTKTSEGAPKLARKSLAENASSNGQELGPLSRCTPCMDEGRSTGLEDMKSDTASSPRTGKITGPKMGHQNLDDLSNAEKAPNQYSHSDTSQSHAVRRSSRLQGRNGN